MTADESALQRVREHLAAAYEEISHIYNVTQAEARRRRLRYALREIKYAMQEVPLSPPVVDTQKG